MWWSFDKRCSSVLWVIGGKKKGSTVTRFQSIWTIQTALIMAAMELLLAHFSQLEAFISKIAYLNVRSAFLFPLGAGLSDTAPPPPDRSCSPAPALKGQYVANKHTEWVNAEPLVRQKQSSLCGPIPALHTLSGYYHVKRAPGWWMNHQAIRAAASERPRLNHYHHLLFTGPSIYWPTMSSC